MSSLSNPSTAGCIPATIGKRAKNLVIVRAGNSSLHPGWLAGPEERNWDIIVNYFGDEPDLYRCENVVRIDSKGAKWPALYDLFRQYRADILRYDYIWLPDDDIAADKNTINRMFDICAELKLELAQPALSHDSYYTHLITLKNSEFMVRYTNFVEIMAPIFSRAFLPPCADSFKENLSGFGLDLLWPTWLGGDNKAAIIDACVVRHTRVLGGPNHKAVTATGSTPTKELAGIFTKFGLFNTAHRIVGGIDHRGHRMSIAEGQGSELVQRVIAGYLPEMVKEKNALLSLLQPILRELPSAPADTSAVQKYQSECERRAQTALRMAAGLVQTGNPAHAAKVLGFSLAENETCELWNDWATAQHGCGDPVRAEWGYRCALRLNPSYREAAVNLALLMLTQKRSNEALPLLAPHSGTLSEQEKQVIRQLTLQARIQMPETQEAFEPVPYAPPNKTEVCGERTTHDLVLARYSEDLEWITGIPEDFDVIIYNKGEPITSPTVRGRAKLIIDKSNIGRESETYLDHMLRMREAHVNPARYTAFCQGDPFDHSPDFLELLKNWRQWEILQPLSWRWRTDKNIPPAEALELDRTGFETSLKVRPELYSLLTWNPIDFPDQGAYHIGKRYRENHVVPEGTNLASHFLRICGLDDLAGIAAEHLIGRFSYGAIFAARNQALLSLPLEQLRRMHFVSQRHVVYGYMFERMWLHLLGDRFLLPSTVRHGKNRASLCATATRLDTSQSPLTPEQPPAFQEESLKMSNLPAYVLGRQEPARHAAPPAP